MTTEEKKKKAEELIDHVRKAHEIALELFHAGATQAWRQGTGIMLRELEELFADENSL